MITFIEKKKSNPAYKALCIFTAIAFIFCSVIPSYAQSLFSMPVPGTMVTPTDAFVPVLLKGMTVHPDNPFKFDFILDSGHTDLSDEQMRAESKRLVKYFLASMTVPKDDLWVNLSPYEKDRIVPEDLGKTELGRDLLAQDYILKQLTASLMYPENELGKKFWEEIYEKAGASSEITDIQEMSDWAGKVWIMPESATVYENGATVYVVDSKLKVMLEQDKKIENGKSKGEKNDRSSIFDPQSSALKEIIVPAIEKEVNEGEHFAPLRQIYHSLILAKWYKETAKDSLLSKVYVDQNKVVGVEAESQGFKDDIYAQYMEAYKEGVYDYIKEDYDPEAQQVIPKKYFSGGIVDAAMTVEKTKDVRLIEGSTIGRNFDLAMLIRPEGDEDVDKKALRHKEERREIRNAAPTIFVIAGTSGTGKTTLANYLLNSYGDRFTKMIRSTSRSAREDDDPDEPFRFLTDEEFEGHASNGDIYFRNDRYGFKYGYLHRSIIDAIRSKKIILLQAWKSSMLMQEFWPNARVVRIGIMPDDRISDKTASEVAATVRERIQKRNPTMDPLSLTRRTTTTLKEVYEIERLSDAVIVNGAETELQDLFSQLDSIVADLFSFSEENDDAMVTLEEVFEGILSEKDLNDKKMEFEKVRDMFIEERGGFSPVTVNTRDLGEEDKELWEQQQVRIAFHVLFDRITPFINDRQNGFFTDLERAELLEIIENTFLLALDKFIESKKNNPLHHSFIVLELLLKIAIGERWTYAETRNLCVAAILHDHGFADSTLDRISSPDILEFVKEHERLVGENVLAEDIESAFLKTKEIVNKAIRSRKEHMKKGKAIASRTVKKLNEHLPEWRKFKPFDFKMIIKMVGIHDNPGIAKYANDYSDYTDEELENVLFSAEDENIYKVAFREADRLWMLTPEGVIKDIMTQFLKGKTPKTLEEQIEKNKEAFTDERNAYREASAGFVAGAFQDEETFMRTETGKVIYDELVAGLEVFKADEDKKREGMKGVDQAMTANNFAEMIEITTTIFQNGIVDAQATNRIVVSELAGQETSSNALAIQIGKSAGASRTLLPGEKVDLQKLIDDMKAYHSGHGYGLVLVSDKIDFDIENNASNRKILEEALKGDKVLMVAYERLISGEKTRLGTTYVGDILAKVFNKYLKAAGQNGEAIKSSLAGQIDLDVLGEFVEDMPDYDLDIDGDDREEYFEANQALSKADEILDLPFKTIAEAKRTGKKRILVLTGGGPASGHNQVLLSLVKEAEANDIEVIGIRQGWKGLVAEDLVNNAYVLTSEGIEKHAKKGGTILKTDRLNPFPEKKFDKTVPETIWKNITETLQADGLITMGGDDTSGAAMKLLLAKQGFPIIAIPKTMDNDLPLENKADTYGFSSFSKAVAKYLKDVVLPYAKKNKKIIVAEAFGRGAGFAPLRIGKLIGATRTLIPEKAINLKELISDVRKYYEANGYASVVVSEGVAFDLTKGYNKKLLEEALDADPFVKAAYDKANDPNAPRDGFGHLKLQYAGDIVSAILEYHLRDMDIDGEPAVKTIGKMDYLFRSADTSEEDLKMTAILGKAAIDYFRRGETNKLLYVTNDKPHSMSLADETVFSIAKALKFGQDLYPSLDNLGKFIRAKRESMKISVNKLAKRLGISSHKLNHIEQGGKNKKVKKITPRKVDIAGVNGREYVEANRGRVDEAMTTRVFNQEINKFKLSETEKDEAREIEAQIMEVISSELENRFKDRDITVMNFGSSGRFTYVGKKLDFDIAASVGVEEEVLVQRLTEIFESGSLENGFREVGLEVELHPDSINGFEKKINALNKKGTFYVIQFNAARKKDGKKFGIDIPIIFDQRHLSEEERGLSMKYQQQFHAKMAALGKERADQITAETRFLRHLLKKIGAEATRKRGGFVGINSEQLIMNSPLLSFDSAMELVYKNAFDVEGNVELVRDVDLPIKMVSEATDGDFFATVSQENWEKLAFISKRYIDMKRSGNFDLNTLTDPAMLPGVGGIDLNEISVDRKGSGVDIQFDPAMMQEFMDMNITGFTPVIINLTPVSSILPLLGLGDAPEDESIPQLSSLDAAVLDCEK